MKKINCIVVDDEPLALEVITDYISKVPFLNLLKSFDSALEALQFTAQHSIDLVFLDVQMPDLNGIQWIKSLTHRPDIIFTTAYDHYAIQGFELQAIDYLMKPIPFERFLLAANKAFRMNEQIGASVLEQKPKEKEVDFIFIKSEYHIEKVILKDLLYVEGMKDYLCFQLTGGKLLSLMNFQQAEDLLPKRNFVRVHKSFVISINQISTIERDRIRIKDKIIPVGKTYKDGFYERLRQEKRIL